MDKGGNFIGWLSVEGKNLSVMLVEEGLCKVLPQAERLTFGKLLFDAEEKAKEAKKNIWEVRMFEQYNIIVQYPTLLCLVEGREKLSLVPRLSWEGKESLVTTACTFAKISILSTHDPWTT